MYAIKTSGLVKRYKDIAAVDQLDLEIRQGELFSLLGVNGAGKTTSIKMLTGLTAPTAGEAWLGGFSISGQAEQVKQLIGVSPQETAVAADVASRRKVTWRRCVASPCFALAAVYNRHYQGLSAMALGFVI